MRQSLWDHEKVTGLRLNVQHPLWQDRETRGTLVHRNLMSRQQPAQPHDPKSKCQRENGRGVENEAGGGTLSHMEAILLGRAAVARGERAEGIHRALKLRFMRAREHDQPCMGSPW